MFIVIYTDPDFPFNEANIFFTSQAYKSAKDFEKNSGVGDCNILHMISLKYYQKFMVSR